VIQLWVREFVEQRGQLFDELIGFELEVAGQPGADGLPDAADHEVRRRFDAIVCWDVQNVADVLSGKDGEQCAGFGAFTHDHGVRQLGAEQQASDSRIARDGPHNVGHTRSGWVVAARSATTQSKTAPTNSSLSVKLS
jgi:hypothetical protein